MKLIKISCACLAVILIMNIYTSIEAQEKNEGQTINPAQSRVNESRYYYSTPTGNPFRTDGETDFKSVVRYSVLALPPVMTILYGSKVWNWGENRSWRWAHERWFQSGTDSGGADKAGHAFAHYSICRLSYTIFSYTENSRERALAYSGITAGVIGTLIEIGDATTGRYGFSKEDLISDFFGITVGLILDRYPTLDMFLGFTANYCPSKAYREYNDKDYLDFAGDYSGWKYMFNLKLAGLEYIGLPMPEVLRYVQFDVGYFTRNYTDYDNSYGHYDAKRYWYWGISLNMREAAKDFFLPDKKAAWLAEQPFKYYNPPFGYENRREIK